MKNKFLFTRLACFRAEAYRYVEMISLLLLVIGAIGLSSCGRKSQQQEDEANLKLVGYDLDQVGFFKAVRNDDVQALQIFKERGFDLSQREDQGRSAIHVAAESGSVRAIHFLVKHGAQIEAADEEGVTPLMAAAGAGRAENSEAITYLLEKGADARRKDKVGKFALIHAMDGKSMDSVHLIASETEQLLDTGILYAANMDYHESIPVLVKYGASVYARNGGKTSLMIAAERGNEKSVKALIDEGSNLYAVSDDGLLAKDYAEGNDAVLTILLESEVVTATETNPLAMEWSEEELEHLVQKAMERSEVGQIIEVNDLGETSDLAEVGDRTEIKSSNDIEIVKLEVPKEKVKLERIKGKNLPLVLNDDVAVEEQMTMATYTEKSLPIKVKTDDAGRIQVYDLRGNHSVQAARLESHATVKEGEQIGMTGLRVKQIRKKIVNNKLTDGYDKELVTLLIEDEKSGQFRELFADYNSQIAEAVAVIKLNGSGEYLIVERDDEFYDLNGKAYKVMDVNDEEVIIENIESGKLSMLPLMGIKR
jgi:ankyrin repeat protein